MFNLLFGPSRGRRVGCASARDGVSFTAHRASASIAEAAVKRQSLVQLELGSKNPLVVLDDADLDRAVAVALDGAFYATGQRCTASSRLIVQDGVHDRFVQALGEKVRALRVGDALDPQTQMGPAVSRSQQETSYRYIELATSEGGRVSVGGERLTLDKRDGTCSRADRQHRQGTAHQPRGGVRGRWRARCA